MTSQYIMLTRTYGVNCGKIIYKAKSDEWTHLTEKDVSTNPMSYAKRIWDRY